MPVQGSKRKIVILAAFAVGLILAISVSLSILWQPQSPEWLPLPQGYAVTNHKVLWEGDGFEGPDQYWSIRSDENVSTTKDYVLSVLGLRGEVSGDSTARPDGIVKLWMGSTHKIIVEIHPAKSGCVLHIWSSIGL